MAAQLPPKSTGSTKLDSVVQNVSAADPQKLSGFALYSRFVSYDIEDIAKQLLII